MYRFRTTFELSYTQMTQYVRLYAKRADMPMMVVMYIISAVFLAGAIYFGVTQKVFEAIFFVLLAICSVVMRYILMILHHELLLKRLPFAIGTHISMELQDDFFHVNCSGQMKSYLKGDLDKIVLTNGDYVLWKKRKRMFQKRDIIVIPATVLTDLMRSELEQFTA